MKKNNGFTLAEILVALTVLAVLIITVLPAVRNSMPNQNKIMMKKAYYTTAETVSDLINDPTLYPESDSTGNHYVGFDNKLSVTYDNNKTTSNSDSKKFIELFANIINPKVDLEQITPAGNVKECTGVRILPGGKGERAHDDGMCFYTITKDGMKWYFSYSVRMGRTDAISNILVDVNGDKKPNCYQGSDADGCADRDDFDQFRMSVYEDGAIKISTNDVWAQEAIGVGSSLTD